MRVAGFSPQWTQLVGTGGQKGALAWRSLGKGVIVHLVSPELAVETVNGRRTANGPLLSALTAIAAGEHSPRTDGRRVPWENEGIGGAFYPEREIDVSGVTVLYADSQLPDTIELAKTRFTDVMGVLQKMLPTPPNPGEAFYIELAAGNGGGWAENAYTPKLAGTIATNHEAILSILAHELAHTMYGPAAVDGTPGCALPDWFSEAHAGWFQRKAMGRLGYGDGGPAFNAQVAKQDPLLDDLDLANIPDGTMGLAWSKAWVIWSILDARYGEQWYPRWMEYLHNTYNDPKRQLTMDECIVSMSHAVGEDLAPLFERFGTTVGARTDLPPIGPPH
jgi:hypothetical protein